MNVVIAIGAFALGGIARLYLRSADALVKLCRRWLGDRRADTAS